MNRLRIVVGVNIVFAIAAGFSSGLFANETSSPQSTVFLFSYFVGNGEDGLHFAWSEDGYTWQPVAEGRSFLKPQVGSRLMGDPCNTRGPDGAFQMVWTTGWQDRGIGLAHSHDLIQWSQQRYLPLMEKVNGARNCWAPEIIWDPDTQQYVIYWSSTIEGRFLETANSGDDGWNHRIYRAVTRDFNEFSPAALFYDPGFNAIDATIVRGPDSWVMVIKDETRQPPAKNLCVAFSSSILGPWSPPSAPFSPPGLWVEGPTVLRVGPYWMIYYDQYTQGRYGAMRTKDFRTFEVVSPACRFPAGMRHGTAFPVERDILDRLQATPSD